MALTQEQVRRVLDVALRLGEALLARQAGSADVADSVLAVTAAYGVPDAQVDITGDSITVSVPRGVPGAPVTAMRVVTARSPDYTRLYEATHLAQRIVAERPALSTVQPELLRPSRGGHPYPRWVSTVSLTVMAASLSLLLSAGALVVVIAGLTTSLIDRVGRLLNARRVPLLFQQVIGAALAAGVTVGLDAAGRLPAGQAPSLVVAASIAVLLSGLATVGTMQDAITGYLLTATARSVEIPLSSIGVLVGVTIAVRFGVFAGLDVKVSPDIPAGAAGSLLYLVATLAGAGPVTASFVAALGIGLAGALCARRLRLPALVIVMAGIFPLVPGLSLYRGFVDLSTGRYPGGLGALITATGIALALGGGVALGPLPAPALRRELGQLRTHHPTGRRQWRHGRGHRLPALAGVGTNPGTAVGRAGYDPFHEDREHRGPDRGGRP